MKYDLKNRPRKTTNTTWKVINEWFEGFEKEVRDKLAHKDCQGFNRNEELLKEILG